MSDLRSYVALGPLRAAFRKAMVAMAHSVDATFVLVDLGPHTDKLHKVWRMQPCTCTECWLPAGCPAVPHSLLRPCMSVQVMIMSADAIQPVVAFCIYSCFSTFNFLRLVLPDWITWAEGMSSKQAPEGYAYTKQLPRILPFLGLNVSRAGCGRNGWTLLRGVVCWWRHRVLLGTPASLPARGESCLPVTLLLHFLLWW